MASKEASWDTKASFPQAPYDSTTTQYTDPIQFITFGIIRRVLSQLSGLCSYSCHHTLFQKSCRIKRRCDRQVKSCWLAQDLVSNQKVSCTGVAVMGEMFTHFHLDTEMSLLTGLCKDITQFVVEGNNITTPL